MIRTIVRSLIDWNIHCHEVESLLHHLGAQIETLSGNRSLAQRNSIEVVPHLPHQGHSLDWKSLRGLRGLGASVGVAASPTSIASSPPSILPECPPSVAPEPPS